MLTPIEEMSSISQSWGNCRWLSIYTRLQRKSLYSFMISEIAICLINKDKSNKGEKNGDREESIYC